MTETTPATVELFHPIWVFHRRWVATNGREDGKVLMWSASEDPDFANLIWVDPDWLIHRYTLEWDEEAGWTDGSHGSSDEAREHRIRERFGVPIEQG